MADDTPGAPIEEDVRHDDLEYNPALEPKKAKAWLNLIEESEDAFERWHDHCDKIDKQYASLERLAGMARDKEFQMMWANLRCSNHPFMRRPPVPVVVPKFKGPAPSVSERIRGDGAVCYRRVRLGIYQRPHDAGQGRRGADRPRRCMVSL